MKFVMCTAIFLCGTSVVTSTLAAEQQILFCAESISYTKDRYGANENLCLKSCREFSSSDCLQEKTDAGWVIASATSKSVPSREQWFGACSCVGTQYILNRPDEKPSSPTSNSEISLLNKEIELLKKENEMLKKDAEIFKKETTMLKTEIETLRSKPAPKKK